MFLTSVGFSFLGSVEGFNKHNVKNVLFFLLEIVLRTTLG